jgi:hypothetical protein
MGLRWFLSDDAAALVQTVGSLMDESYKEKWPSLPWVQQLIGWWNMMAFRSMNFKIN